jgi:hypothetical protein
MQLTYQTPQQAAASAESCQTGTGRLGRLKAATETLLRCTAPAVLAMTGLAQANDATDPREKTWDIDTSVLYYSEADRVSAAEPVISATKKLSGERFWNLKLVVDSLTGSTPNGAAPSDSPQSFTSPSGRGTYEAQAGDIPLDSYFRETARVALSTQYTAPLSDNLKATGGIAFSTEHDYRSLGLNANLARDFNQHNTTLSVGFAYASDAITPEGGVPKPLGLMGAKGEADDTKTVTDVLIGVTQVLSPTWLLQANYSLSQQQGYLTDPYKIVSLLETDGRPYEYRYESRPDDRTKQSLFLLSKSHHAKSQVLTLSYRFHTDDWGIDSHTVDGLYHWQLNARHSIEPHLRLYQQSAADFYTQGLSRFNPLPTFMSADSRLGEFTAVTLGAQYGYHLSEDSQFHLRLEWYQQTGQESSLPGDLDKRYDVYPDLDAMIVQVGYSFAF